MRLERKKMKHQEQIVTKEELYQSRHQNEHVYGVKKGYCDLISSCERCNPKIRFWCKIIHKIEDRQTKIIKTSVK